jgi:hypothetical protein
LALTPYFEKKFCRAATQRGIDEVLMLAWVIHHLAGSGARKIARPGPENHAKNDDQINSRAEYFHVSPRSCSKTMAEL